MNGFTRLEQLQYAYLAMLQANIRAELDIVQTFWEGEGDALPLQDIAQWETGNMPEGFERTIIKKWPCVTVEVTSVVPSQQDGSGLVGLVDSLFVTVYTLGQTASQADKYAHRYAAAIANSIFENKPKGVGIKSAGPISLTVGEAVGLSQVNYFKGSQVKAPLRIGISLQGA